MYKIKNLEVKTNPLEVYVNGEKQDISNTMSMDIHIEKGILTIKENVIKTYMF
jgi:hypothetical protein